MTAGTSGSAPGGGGGGGYTGGGCVDTLTEIFTQRGWLRYDQVSEGDHVWAIDTDSGKEKWSLVTLVRIFTGMRDTVVLDTPEGKVVSTPEHRHVVSGYALVTAAEIDTSYQLTGEKAALPVTGLEKGQADTVWCPTTEHSTWLAKRGSLIFFTGNKP